MVSLGLWQVQLDDSLVLMMYFLVVRVLPIILSERLDPVDLLNERHFASLTLVLPKLFQTLLIRQHDVQTILTR